MRRASGASTTKTRRRRKPAARTSTSRQPPGADNDLNETIEQLRRERDEALEQQTATSEILGVIRRSPTNAQPVFDAIVESASRLCEGVFSVLWRYDGDLLHYAASHNFTRAVLDRIFKAYPKRPDRSVAAGRAILDGKIAHVPDMLADPGYAHELALAGNWRASIAVPMLRDGKPIGAISVGKAEAGPFSERQMHLLSTFADQAVIAIENARLFNEIREALEQQTATSEVLKVISSSAGELEPVFNTMLANATRICEATFGNMFLSDGPLFRSVAVHSKGGHANSWRRNPVIDLHDNAEVPLNRVANTKQVLHIPDLRTDQSYIGRHRRIVTLVESAGARTYLIVPMLKEGELVGAISMFRQEVRPFTDKQIELVKNFASQAVIAIENTRLLNELRKSLQQQTATADVLKTISRSTFHLNTVLYALAKSAKRLCMSDQAYFYLLEGKSYRLAASCGFSPQAEALLKQHTIMPGRNTLVARTSLEGRVIHIEDVLVDPEYTYSEAQKLIGFRTLLGVPLLREGTPIGVLTLSRCTVQRFTQKQIDLVSTFADQAVIAIENVRLFEAEQQRTHELSEALERQTATSEVLKVISSSSGKLEPVFHTMLANATRICEAAFGSMLLVEGEVLRRVALHNAPSMFVEFNKKNPVIPLGQVHDLNLLFETRRPVHIADAAGTEDSPIVKYGGARTLVIVPMLKGREIIGAIGIYRQEVLPFTDKQIELVTNFAAQAVIAIENARLLNELRKSLQQQTATADVLKVISRSTFDLQTVLQTLVKSAARLCEADMSAIHRPVAVDGTFERIASHGFPAKLDPYMKNASMMGRGSLVGRVLLDGAVVQIPDALNDPEYTTQAPRIAGFRTMLGVPLLREGLPIGIMVLTRRTVRPFTDKQIELVSSFADQAVIAIENVRLFESVEARTRELAKSLEDLRTTQDRLVQTQKLASLGQLTAGIAHEIKNPLNFVNNFSAVSVELIDELRQALTGAHLDSKLRAEISEVANMLQGNLDKIVQHGKRADAIVKNMLLHSREGSGEHRVVDINALVEESLNLAYHGARAEKQGFNISLERSFDPAAGQADVFPQDITRVLLNMILNGFYAATKRRAEAGDGYEPTLTASTRSLGDRVEIRIRDNGTGIPPEVKDKMFNPFFTTKPAGEGTGLGLSISHDIIVKQHGGSIEVETEPGEYTEFRIILPRAAAFVTASEAQS